MSAALPETESRILPQILYDRFKSGIGCWRSDNHGFRIRLDADRARSDEQTVHSSALTVLQTASALYHAVSFFHSRVPRRYT